MSTAILGNYKGHPTIELAMAGEERGFTFGLKKARAILDNLEAIRGFVETGGKGLKVEVKNNGGSEHRPSASLLFPIRHTASSPADRMPWPQPATVTVACDNGGPANGAAHVTSDEALRDEPNCRGCGKDKAGQGLLVCWDCFKRHPLQPLQTSGMSPAGWLAKFGRFDGKGGQL